MEMNPEEGYETLHYLHNHPSSSSMDRTDRSSPAATPSRSILSADSFTYCRTNSEISAFSDPTDDSASFAGTPSPRWPPPVKSPKRPLLSRLGVRHSQNFNTDDEKIEDHEEEEHLNIELERMKERFSKLLLGGDMSGSGKGVSTAVTISNAITNLYASVFGQHQRLEPFHPEKKLMWRREMNCLLSVCDYIVEFVPIQQTLRDGSEVEVMESRPRSDIQINLPALKKLDSMLLEILATFEETEFWYVEPGSILGTIATRTGSFRKLVQPQRTDEKWWLPVPCVPANGLSDKARKHLRQKRESANQIHKAAMAINSTILAEMEIPETYMASLPKSGKISVGETIYRYMNVSSKFSPEHLLDNLNISSEHEALELADRVEASMYVWRRKACLGNSRSSWDLMKELLSDIDRNDKNHVLAGRAHSLLFCLKQRYPELSQTSLDTCKIQLNRDVGQAILESYSRVLEGLAFNIVALMDDVLYVDKKTRSKDN